MTNIIVESIVYGDAEMKGITLDALWKQIDIFMGFPIKSRRKVFRK